MNENNAVTAGIPTTLEELKAFRVEVDALIQKAIKINLPYNSVKGDYLLRRQAPQRVWELLTEAKMWLGKCMEASGSELPVEFRDKSTQQ
jgi:hypothetical protein